MNRANMPSSEDEGVTQLAEALHRARNDLATIASMLLLQAKGSHDVAVVKALDEARQRVVAISRVNDAIDNAARSEPTIDAVGFLTGIAVDLQHVVDGWPITVKAVEGPELPLPVSYARPLALIVNEWVTNAVKYAFPGHRPGSVTVEVCADAQKCHLTVKDDGVGLDPAAAPLGTGVGTRLAKGLAGQLSGEVRINASSGGGTSCTMSFPLP